MNVATESMRAYRVVWLIVCAAFCVVGVSVAWYAAPATLVVVAVESGVVASLWSLVVRSGDQPRQARLRAVLVAALAGGTAGGAFVGGAVVLGVGAVPLAIALIASAPGALRLWGRWLRTAAPSSGPRLDTAVSALAWTGMGLVPFQRADDPCLLTNEQLCGAWHATTAALRECSPHELRHLANQRQWYLDEFERRNPRGLRAWLVSSDTASTDPRVYLDEDRADLPALDWDELTGGPGA